MIVTTVHDQYVHELNYVGQLNTKSMLLYCIELMVVTCDWVCECNNYEWGPKVAPQSNREED